MYDKIRQISKVNLCLMRRRRCLCVFSTTVDSVVKKEKPLAEENDHCLDFLRLSE